ncbi:MAG: AAA family ATPase, partial [Thermomicrobiales bacterium]
MAVGQRSSFGELVYRYRRQLGLTQLQLANRVQDESFRMGGDAGPLAGATLSEKSVANFERRLVPGGRIVRPRSATVKMLAQVFDLEPGTDACDAFFEASNQLATMQSATVPPADSTARRSDVAADKMEPGTQVFVPEGRESHLKRLQAALTRVIAGDPQVAFVSAEPGTGKTWLIEEFCRQAVAEHDDLVVIWGECVGRAGAADPHHAIRQALDIVTGGVLEAGPRQVVSEENRARLIDRVPVAVEAIVERGPGLIDRFISSRSLIERGMTLSLDAALQDAVQRIAHLPLAARSSSDGTNAELYQVLIEYAARGPLILVLEDLHWADEGTCAVLFHFVRALRGRGVRVLIVGTFRPADLVETWAGDRHPFRRVLNETQLMFPDAMIDLSTAVGGEAGLAFIEGYFARRGITIDPSFRERLFAHTGGMPLFVDGILRLYWHERMIARDGDGQIELLGESQLGQLPAEINAVFSEQIERLGPDLRRVLDWASVQGEVFTAEIIMRALRMDSPTMTELLDRQLVHRYGLLAPGGTTTLAGKRVHEYRFSHALLQVFLVKRLSDFVKEHYHNATAAAYSSLFGDDPHEASAAMAWHFEQSGDRSAAAKAYKSAGDYAMNADDFAVATAQYEHSRRLIAAYEDPETSAQVLVGLANCALSKPDPGKAWEYAMEAYELAVRFDLQSVRAHSQTALGMMEYDAGRMSSAKERFTVAIDELIAIEDWMEVGRALTLLSHSLYGQGAYDAALAAARQAQLVAERYGSDWITVGAIIAETNCLVDLGMFEEAIASYQRCLELCGRIGHTRGQVLCWVNIGLCHVEQREWCLAREAMEQVFQIVPRASMYRTLGFAEYYSGLADEGTGDWLAAVAHFERALRL